MSLGGKQTFSHDEKSCKKSQRLAKVHLCVFTQPRSALYPVASYHLMENVAARVIQPCSHTVIQLCELGLGRWPDVTVSVIIFMFLLPLLHFKCSSCGRLLAKNYGCSFNGVLFHPHICYISFLHPFIRVSYQLICWLIIPNMSCIAEQYVGLFLLFLLPSTFSLWLPFLLQLTLFSLGLPYDISLVPLNRYNSWERGLKDYFFSSCNPYGKYDLGQAGPYLTGYCLGDLRTWGGRVDPWIEGEKKRQL